MRKKIISRFYCLSLFLFENYREKIETFIDENKALIKRMFGDYTNAPVDGEIPDSFETYDGKTLRVRTERASPKNSFAATSNK